MGTGRFHPSYDSHLQGKGSREAGQKLTYQKFNMRFAPLRIFLIVCPALIRPAPLSPTCPILIPAPIRDPFSSFPSDFPTHVTLWYLEK